MKELIIPGKRIATELRWLGISLLIAFVVNVYSIIRYDTAWSELLTSLHIVLLLSLLVYVILLFFRGLISLLLRFTRGKD